MLPSKTPSLHPNVIAVQQRLEAAGSGSRILLLDEGVHTAAAAAQALPRVRQLGCAQLLAETMTRISNEESVSSLFTD